MNNMLQKVIKVAAFNSTNCGDAKKKKKISYICKGTQWSCNTDKDNTLITEHYFTNTWILVE